MEIQLHRLAHCLISCPPGTRQVQPVILVRQQETVQLQLQGLAGTTPPRRELDGDSVDIHGEVDFEWFSRCVF